MGCDIHAHVEVLTDRSPLWQHYNNKSVDRWYELFTKMAGVRGDLKDAIVAPKGLPNNLSLITELDYKDCWEGDAHSQSWFSIEEMCLLEKWLVERTTQIGGRPPFAPLEDRFGYLFGHGWSEWIEFPDSREKFLKDVRLVFWFDN